MKILFIITRHPPESLANLVTCFSVVSVFFNILKHKTKPRITKIRKKNVNERYLLVL